MPDEMVSISVDKVVRESDKAILCEIDGVEHWMPKSQIDSGGLRGVGSSGMISVPQWLVKAKELNVDGDGVQDSGPPSDEVPF